jgi:hypothetical protein
VNRYDNAKFYGGAFSLPNERALPKGRDFRSGERICTIRR